MRFDLSSILLLIAVVLFLLDGFSVNLGSLALVPLGLAAFAASFLFTKGGFLGMRA
jgi:predicted anti-sigma-YlaC factor YlaD